MRLFSITSKLNPVIGHNRHPFHHKLINRWMQIIFHPWRASIWISFHPHRILSMGFTWHKKLGITFFIIKKKIPMISVGYLLGMTTSATCQVSAASPLVLNMWLQTVKFIAEKSKCAGLAQEIGFFAPNLCILRWLVMGATQLCTSRKECNKLDLTAAQYFWLVDYKIGPGGLLLVVSTNMQFPLQFYWWGCQQKNS